MANSSASSPSSNVVGVFWNLGNQPVPEGMKGREIAQALSSVCMKYGKIKVMNCYAQASVCSRSIREQLTSAGVSLIDVTPPKKRNDGTDFAMLTDIMMFAVDNPAPATIILITGDCDFSSSLIKLRQRQFKTIVMAKSSSWVSHTLKSLACEFVYFDPSPSTTAHTKHKKRKTSTEFPEGGGSGSSDPSGKRRGVQPNSWALEDGGWGDNDWALDHHSNIGKSDKKKPRLKPRAREDGGWGGPRNNNLPREEDVIVIDD